MCAKYLLNVSLVLADMMLIVCKLILLVTCHGSVIRDHCSKRPNLQLILAYVIHSSLYLASFTSVVPVSNYQTTRPIRHEASIHKIHGKKKLADERAIKIAIKRRPAVLQNVDRNGASPPQSHLGRARRHPSRQRKLSPASCATSCAMRVHNRRVDFSSSSYR